MLQIFDFQPVIHDVAWVLRTKKMSQFSTTSRIINILKVQQMKSKKRNINPKINAVEQDSPKPQNRKTPEGERQSSSDSKWEKGTPILYLPQWQWRPFKCEIISQEFVNSGDQTRESRNLCTCAGVERGFTVALHPWSPWCMCPHQMINYMDNPCLLHQLWAHGGTRLLRLLPDTSSHAWRVVMDRTTSRRCYLHLWATCTS